MKRPGFWIALVLFVGLFAWIRWFESRKPVETKTGPPSFLALEPTKVKTITAAWIDTTRMEKKAGVWMIVSPVSFPADPYAVEALLSRTRDLELRRRFTSDSTIQDPYGVENPRAWIRFDLDDGTTSRLLIGNPAPASPSFYVQMEGHPEIGLLSDQDVDNYFRKDENGWRRRELFTAPTRSVTGFDLSTAASHVLVERGTDRLWRVEKPFPGPADGKTVDEFVKGLLAMKARGYPVDAPASLEPYGLTRPAGRIILFLDEGLRDTLLLGTTYKEVTGPLRYALTSGLPNVLGVPAAYVDVAGRSDFVFRDRRLFRTEIGYAESLVIRKGGATLAFSPDSSHAWRLAGEMGSPGTPAPDRADFVRDWIRVGADSILAASGARFSPGGESFDVTVTSTRGAETISVASPIHLPGGTELWPARINLSDPPRPGEVFLLKPDLPRQTLAYFESRRPENTN